MSARRAWQLARDHRLFVLILAAIFISRVPFLANLHAVLLLNQDFNPEHFGHLFFENDIPAADDSEAGENAGTFSLVSIYYWLPLLAYRIGVPFQFFSGLHALLALPLLSFGIYRLTLALFGNPKIACLAVLVFLFKDFALFRLNLGYPILLNSTIYQSDPAYIFVLFSISAILEKRQMMAASWIAMLGLLNPTSAATLGACYVLYLGFSGELRPMSRKTFISLLIIGFAAFVAFVCVTAATPLRNPAPEAARGLAILGNSHLNPHISMPAIFLAVQCLIFAGLIFTIFVERSLAASQIETDRRTCARQLGYALFAAYLIFGWCGYWLLYVMSPALLVMVAPAKIFMVAAIYLAPYVAYALYWVGNRYPIGTVTAVGFGVVFVDKTWLVWLRTADASIVGGLLLCLLIVVLGALMARYTRLERRQASSMWLYAVITLFLYDFGQSATRIFRSGDVAVGNAFYQIQLQIKKQTPSDSIFVPYRYPGTLSNPYGPFRNWPFRTYSRRGGFGFWAVGRNIYFNSARRHELESAGFAAFGVDFWDSVLGEADAAKRRDPLFYYTGIRTDGGMPRLEATPVWTILAKPYDALQETVSKMTLDEFKKRSAALGASHVIVSRDRGAGTELHGLLENDYFVVLPVK